MKKNKKKTHKISDKEIKEIGRQTHFTFIIKTFDTKKFRRDENHFLMTCLGWVVYVYDIWKKSTFDGINSKKQNLLFDY